MKKRKSVQRRKGRHHRNKSSVAKPTHIQHLGGATTTGARAAVDHVDTNEWLDSTRPGPTPSGPPALRLEPNPHAVADATIKKVISAAKKKGRKPVDIQGLS